MPVDITALDDLFQVKGISFEGSEVFIRLSSQNKNKVIKYRLFINRKGYYVRMREGKIYLRQVLPSYMYESLKTICDNYF